MKTKIIKMTHRKNQRKPKLTHHTKSGMVNLSFGKGHPFPPSMRTKVRTTGVLTIQSNGIGITGDSAVDCFFLANTAHRVKLYIGSPAGSSPNAPIVNYPSGASYLIGKQSIAGGASAPYGRGYVSASKIRLKILTESTPNKCCALVCLPVYYGQGTLPVTQISTSNLREQNASKIVVIPPVLTNKGIRMSNRISIKNLFGLKSVDRDDLPYTSDAVGDPAQPMYWLVRVANIDATQLAAPFLIVAEYEIENTVEFYDRNLTVSEASSVESLGVGGATGESGFVKFTGGSPGSTGYTGTAGSGELFNGSALDSLLEANSGVQGWTIIP